MGEYISQLTRPTAHSHTSSAHAPRAAANRIRRRVVHTPLLLAEDLRCPAALGRAPEDHSADFQVCLPYQGLFVWHVGSDDVVADANQVLFVRGNETYSLSQPIARAYAELIVTPRMSVLAEVAQVPEVRLADHPLFRRRYALASPELQRERARCLRNGVHGGADALGLEEAVLALLTSAVSIGSTWSEPSRPTRRLIARTKELLEANVAHQLHLSEIAQAVGASPAYLTSTFRRAEGVPLHRYLMQLRLARAVIALPHANDLTDLALGLGFSSHSHFSAAFRSAYDCTPSQFRGLSRGRQRSLGVTRKRPS